MSLPILHPEPSRPFASRTAFLLNANARAVNRRLAARLLEIVPEGDLFLSHSLEDAEQFVQTIVRRGYGELFVGGGDGTLVSTVNLVDRVCEERDLPRPRIGMLKLGTGNAMSYLLGAKGALTDTWHAVNHGEAALTRVDLIECDDGSLTPFAGMGYDGEVLNDYCALKEATKGPIGHYLVETVWGYLGALFGRTVPRHLRGEPASVRVSTAQDAFFMRPGDDGDIEVKVPAGSVLYDGPASFTSVGSIPFFGFGFTMFPFARRRSGYMQLRVGAPPVRSLLGNLFTSVWQGTYRHPKMFDFLVKDVTIESSDPLAYQVGGDAKGSAKRLHFKVSDRPVEMLALGKRLSPSRSPLSRLLEPVFAPKRV